MAGIPWGTIAEAIGIIASIASNPEAMDQATKAARSAGKALSTGKDMAINAAGAAAPVAKKAVDAGHSAVNAVGKAASGALEKGGNVAGSAVGAVKGKRESREQAKALIEARRQILYSASASLNAEQFQADWAKALRENLHFPLKSPGYFVIAIYKGKPGKNDWGKYANVFVERSQDMGASIHRHLSGNGNPDVYADMKYGKYVHVFAYPDFDEVSNKDDTLSSFMLALGANQSYNARVIDAVANNSMYIEIAAYADEIDNIASSMTSIFPNIKQLDTELCGNGTVKLLFSSSANSPLL